jgi:hypothetical protein
MPQARAEYLAATRHPWACALFVLPLLAVYEAGLLWLGPGCGESTRNGADVWIRRALDGAGVRQWFAAPALLAVGLLGWSWLRRSSRPGQPLAVCLGMVLESIAFGLGLWGSCHGLWHVLASAGGPGECDPAVRQLIGYVGAGIYEETLFRLLLFSLLGWLLRLADFPPGGALALAALLSGLAFSLAHHIGPHGEAVTPSVFLFRSLAGVYFALLFHFRGFGVAVGAHAGYDVLVGVLAEV